MAAPIPVGTPVAFQHPVHSWVKGTVADHNPEKKRYTITCKADSESYETLAVDVHNIQWDLLDEEHQELLKLTQLHESTLLSALRNRFLKDYVYTNIGSIVVAINPWNYNIEWYKEKQMGKYQSEGPRIQTCLPHTWGIAHNAYHTLLETKINQTIVVSGESGAGKTEAAKMVVKYIAAYCTKRAMAKGIKSESNVSNSIQQASPILEAFGNAKTVRNDNSSRFGKFVELQFNNEGLLVGAKTTKYLLERSRVVTSAANERIYHAFYQLVKGKYAARFGVDNAETFISLKSGGCLSINDVNDGQNFDETCKAMQDVGMTSMEIDAVWQTLAAILFLQNIQFQQKDDSGQAEINPDSEDFLTKASQLLSIEKEPLREALTVRLIFIRGSMTKAMMTKQQAQDTRDGLSKSLYENIFEWLVNRINKTTDNTAEKKLWIGLLDIFGFEKFDFNSFEQLCINLTNEQIQHFYNQECFESEKKCCQQEGIEIGDIGAIASSSACVSLIAGKGGIMALLDDASNVQSQGGNPDDKFVEDVEKAHNSHPNYEKQKAKSSTMTIRHYAGDVKYDGRGFIEKNKDPLTEGMRSVIKTSSDDFVKELLPDDKGGGPKKKTVSAFFRAQLEELMGVLQATQPNWIRCINPHPAKKPKMFDGQSVMRQLRSAGVLETVKIRKQGYPIRFTHEDFMRRFNLLFGEDAKSPPNPKAGCDILFKKAAIGKEGGQIGNTQVFLRNEAFDKLTKMRALAAEKYLLQVQRFGKGFLGRAKTSDRWWQINKARIAAEKIEHERLMKEKLERERIEAERRAREEREKIKREFEKKERSATLIKKTWRGYICRKNLRMKRLENSRAEAEYNSGLAMERFRDMHESDCIMRRDNEKRWKLEREMLRRKEIRAELESAAKLARETRQWEQQSKKIEEHRFETMNKQEIMLKEKQKREEQKRQIIESERKREWERGLNKTSKLENIALENKLRDEKNKARLLHLRTLEERCKNVYLETRVTSQEREMQKKQSEAEFERGKQLWGMREQWVSTREHYLALQYQEMSPGKAKNSLVNSTQSMIRVKSSPLKSGGVDRYGQMFETQLQRELMKHWETSLLPEDGPDIDDVRW